MATVTSMSSLFKDLYPQGGDRIKQWVVDSRRESEWERATCPTVSVPEHDDNTEMSCRNVSMGTYWTWLQHDCCSVCCELADATADRVDVKAWRAEMAARPPIEQDREKLSDEIQGEIALTQHPLLSMLNRDGKAFKP